MRNLLLGLVLGLTMAATASAESGRAGSTDTESSVRATSSAPAGASTLKAGPPVDTAGFTCHDTEDGGTFCACTSLNDCDALIKSGKCTSDLEVHDDDPPDATCDTDSADRPTDPEAPSSLSAGSNATASAASATMTLKGTAPGGTEFGCSYDDKGNKTGCTCDSFKDCIKMMKKKACGTWDVKKDGVGGTCGNP